MKLNSRIIVPLIVVMFAGGIGLSMAVNLWSTSSDKVPVTFTSGAFAGEYNPADIRGSYSFREISELFKVPLDALERAFRIDPVRDASGVLAKELEAIYGAYESGLEIGTDSVRFFVALYRGIPYLPEESTALPAPALEVLRESGNWNEEQLAELRTRSITGTQLDRVSAVDTDSTPVEHETSADDRTVRGKTTFGEILQWGVTQEDLKDVFGGTIGARGETARDFAMKNGIEFSTAKPKLQDLVDAAQ